MLPDLEVMFSHFWQGVQESGHETYTGLLLLLYYFVLARSRVKRDTQIILPSLENYLHIELLI